MIRLGLLALVPLAPVLHYLFGLPPLWVFVAGILGVGVLADWIRAATENIAQHTGPAVGGLLTISLGSLAACRSEVASVFACLGQSCVAGWR